MKSCVRIVLCLVLLAGVARAENWPQFRGPHFNGSSRVSGLPVEFGPQKNVVWSVSLPGAGAATPIVWEDRVFISSTDPDKGNVKAICINRLTGEQIWQRTHASDGIRQDTRSTFAAPTPATDGEQVIFFYGDGQLFAFDLDGKQKWTRSLGPFAFNWTFSTSPVLYDGKLLMQVLQRNVPVGGRGRPGKNESYLLALDPETGKNIWRQVRPSPAVAESLEAFTTPLPFEHQGRTELVVAGGDVLTGHDLESGKELWRWGTWNPTRIGHWRLVPSPVASEDVILVCAPKKDPIYALQAGGEGRLDDSALAWVSRDQRVLSSDVPTPAYYDGDFFILSDVQRSLSRVDPRSGKIEWSIRTPGRRKYEASPLAADGKIYVINFDGEVTVVDAADGRILATVAMEDQLDNEYNVRSSVIAAQGQLFVRTNSKLYCIAK